MLTTAEALAAALAPEMPAHLSRWASLTDTLNWPVVPTDPDEALTWWQTRVSRLYNTLRKRPTLCWEQIRDAFGLTDEEAAAILGPQPAMPEDAIL